MRKCVSMACSVNMVADIPEVGRLSNCYEDRRYNLDLIVGKVVGRTLYEEEEDNFDKRYQCMVFFHQDWSIKVL